MTKQEQLNEQRAKYLSGEITHDTYYCCLADYLRIPHHLIPVDNEKVVAALERGDKNLNSIPLTIWDDMDGTVRYYVAGLSWSLSDTVCVLKAMARRRAGNML